jgi:hypothetical protein
MSITRCWRFALPVLFGSLSAIPLSYAASGSYPQIVRIRYVQGDVRVSRGKQHERATGAEWEAAVADLPVEQGFNLVTGAGRAEIEFEDTSTVYLAENSVLTFNKLYTKENVPHTEIALLAGTATVHDHLAEVGEVFMLKTPTNALRLEYPDDSYVRVSSYLDGMRVTPQESMVVHQPGRTGTEELARGRTASYGGNGPIGSQESDRSAFAEWDKWVANRVELRTTATAAVMKESGLKAPIPGLAEMNGQGKFFPCAPYGTCWEPNGLAAPEAGGELQDAQPVYSPVSLQLSQQAGQTRQAAVLPADKPFERDFFFPCPPTSIRSMIVRDPVTGRERVLSSTMDVGTEPYDWAVCHAGSWIYRQHRYAWVAGNKKHHHCPVRWVRTGRTVAYVPIHPRDVAGKLPVNRVHGVFAVNKKTDDSVELLSLEGNREIKVLASPPKEFRSVYFAPLARAEAPQVEAHLMGDRFAAPGSGVKESGIRLAFNQKSQSFTLAREGINGSRSSAGLEEFNGRIGGIQGRSGAFGGGSFGGGSSGGFGRSGSSGSASSGGGASHGPR